MEQIIERLNECMNQVDKIQFDDDVTLEDLLNRTRMYLSKLNKDNASILRFNHSLFSSNTVRDTMWGSNTHMFQKAWEDGKTRFKNIVKNSIEEYIIDHENLNSQNNGVNAQSNSNDIFIIHGRDEGMKETVARVISKLGLNPIILHEQEDKGKTIIEKFEHFAKNSGYAIALLSPDDISIENGIEKNRARQNVIFELGYFTGLLGRERTFALVKGIEKMELLSDYQGVVYKQFENDGWQLKLVKELKALGYSASADRL